MAIDWQAVKKGFETGCKVSELAKKYGCSAETVRKRARKEIWVKEAGPADSAAAIGESADHRSLLNGVKRRLVNGLENSDVKKGLEELRIAKTALEVLSDYRKEEQLAMEHEKNGSKDREMEDAQALASEMAQATAPSGTDKALE